MSRISLAVGLFFSACACWGQEQAIVQRAIGQPAQTEIVTRDLNQVGLDSLEKNLAENLQKQRVEKEAESKQKREAQIIDVSASVQKPASEVRRLDDEKKSKRREEVLKKEIAQLETYLQSYAIAMNREGIQKYLQQLNDSNRDLSLAKKLALQLGSQVYSERKAAERSLMKLPVVPVDLLRAASQSPNSEQAYRANRVLKYALSQQSQNVEKAFRAIELLEFSGLTKEIFETVIKFQDETSVVRSAKATMLNIVKTDDIPFLSSQMNEETIAPLREISICALRQLDDASLADEFDKWSRNGEFAEATRLEAGLALADLGDRRSLNLLASLMVEAEAVPVRVRGKIALRKLTGQNFNYSVYGKPEVRIKQAEPWHDWIVANGQTAELKYPLQSVRLGNSNLNGHTLVALNSGNKVIEYDEAMNEVWSYDCQCPGSAEKMKNGNILIAESGARRVIEVTPEKQIVREHPVRGIYSARPLKNGNFLVTQKATIEGGPAFEIDPQGKVVWELQPRGRFFKDAIRLENGNTLVAECDNNTDRQNVVAEYDPTGKIVWDVTKLDVIDSIQLLENGNVLICQITGDIIEVDKQSKEIVWQLNVEGAGKALRIENGNLLILTKTRFLEVDSNGIEVWSNEIRTTSGSVRR